MRRVLHIVLGLLVLGVLVLVLAPDLGEVGQIRTRDADDVRLPTRVWFIEDGRQIILRGNAGADWVQRLRADPVCDFVRPGQRDDYRASILADRRMASAWSKRFLEKYGWRERALSLRRSLLPSDEWVIVRLTLTGPPRVRR